MNSKSPLMYSSLCDLIGKEINIEGYRDKSFYTVFVPRYREFLIDVKEIPEKNDYELTIAVKNRNKNASTQFTGYKCLYSECTLLPVEEGRTIEENDIQRLLKVIR